MPVALSVCYMKDVYYRTIFHRLADTTRLTDCKYLFSEKPRRHRGAHYQSINSVRRSSMGLFAHDIYVSFFTRGKFKQGKEKLHNNVCRTSLVNLNH